MFQTTNQWWSNPACPTPAETHHFDDMIYEHYPYYEAICVFISWVQPDQPPSSVDSLHFWVNLSYFHLVWCGLQMVLYGYISYVYIYI